MNMKILLNLLPEEEKRITQNRLRSRFLLWQLFLLFLLEIFYLTLSIGMYLLLDFQFESTQSLEVPRDEIVFVQNEKLKNYQDTFHGVNETTAIIGKIERSHLHFTQVFRLLNELLPPGIMVGTLSTKEYSVSLSGMAAKREDLLLLDEKMKNSECITEVNIPLSNLFSQENIDFQIDFLVKQACLQKNDL